MAGKKIEKSWTWTLRSPRKALWPLVSDTERMNEALRLPPYRLRESVDEDGAYRRHGDYDDAGTMVRWEEFPFEWSKNHWWRWDRLYESGPFERTTGTLVMEPDKRGTGTIATYTLVAEPRSMAGTALARTGHLGEAGKAFERLIKLADAHARKPHGDLYANLAATRTGRGRKKSSTAPTLPDSIAPEDRAAAQQLLDWLAVAFDSDLRDIRPKRVARALGIGLGEAHRALVTGLEIGELSRHLRIVCPHCRATIREANTPRDLPRETPCPRCTALVETDYAETVEVLFSPQDSLREPSPLTHCASGPQVSPRIVLQQIMDPHERRDMPATLDPGTYVARSLDGAIRFEFDAEGGKGALIRAGADWIEIPQIEETVVLENHSENVITLIVETADWPADSTSFAEWLTYQRCREATDLDTLALPQNAGTLSLLIISARGQDEAAACLKLAQGHGGAVVEDTGAGTALIFARPSAAKAAINAALQLLPAARIGADYGPLTMVSGAVYVGDPRDKAADLAGLAQEGVPNLSPAFVAAVGG